MEIKKDAPKAYKLLQELISPVYMEKLFSTAERAEGNGKIVLLSAELISS